MIKKNKLHPSVYVAAAKRIDPSESSYSCNAITAVMRERAGGLTACIGGDRSANYKFYQAVYQLESRGFWNLNRERIKRTAKQIADNRVIALLLAAELVKDGFTAEDFR